MSNGCIFVVEDDDELRDALGETLRSAGYVVELIADGRIALDMIEKNNPDLVITDIQMPKMDGHQLLRQIKKRWPDIPVMMMTAFGSIEKAVEAMREGAIDYLTKPFEAEVLVSMVSRYAQQITPNSDMIIADAKSLELASIAKRVAMSDASILITGESGCGKEVLARYIHTQSSRSDKPFIAINCAAIPDNMLESTLFGYEKGAFTGAYKACPGKFELADGGTLLLDEISEMAMPLQAKLLRVLQEKEVERLGATKLIPLNVRILATSNKNMKQEVAEKKFREDLYYRLNVFPLNMSPLRERIDDIEPLTKKLLAKHQLHISSVNCAFVEITDSAIDKLREYSWPGNVRELENVVQRALIVCNANKIDQHDLIFEVDQQTNDYVNQDKNANPLQLRNLTGSSLLDSNLDEELRVVEFQKIVDTLKMKMGDRQAVADSLGISQRTLRYKLAKMREQGIAIPSR